MYKPLQAVKAAFPRGSNDVGKRSCAVHPQAAGRGTALQTPLIASPLPPGVDVVVECGLPVPAPQVKAGPGTAPLPLGGLHQVVAAEPGRAVRYHKLVGVINLRCVPESVRVVLSAGYPLV